MEVNWHYVSIKRLIDTNPPAQKKLSLHCVGPHATVVGPHATVTKKTVEETNLCCS